MIKKIMDKLLTREVITYLIFGVLTTIVNMVVFWLLENITTLHYLVNNSIAWVIAVSFAYITNKLFVFESKSFALNVLIKEIPGFAFARLLSLIFENVFLLVTVELIGVPEIISKLIASVGVIIMNYVASKLFIFKKK